MVSERNRDGIVAPGGKRVVATLNRAVQGILSWEAWKAKSWMSNPDRGTGRGKQWIKLVLFLEWDGARCRWGSMARDKRYVWKLGVRKLQFPLASQFSAASALANRPFSDNGNVLDHQCPIQCLQWSDCDWRTEFLIIFHCKPHAATCYGIGQHSGTVWAAQSCRTLWSHGLSPARFLCPWNSPGKNIGEGSYSLLQGIFPTREGDRTQVSYTAGRFFTVWATSEAHTTSNYTSTSNSSCNSPTNPKQSNASYKPPPVSIRIL